MPPIYSENPAESFVVASGVSNDKDSEQDVVCPTVVPPIFKSKFVPLKTQIGRAHV